VGGVCVAGQTTEEIHHLCSYTKRKAVGEGPAGKQPKGVRFIVCAYLRAYERENLTRALRMTQVQCRCLSAVVPGLESKHNRPGARSTHPLHTLVDLLDDGRAGHATCRVKVR
jgi:hypothetical protein